MSLDNKKSGFVTLVGRPNVGKSTLMNKIIGQKIAITSKKPQTTRGKIQTVYTCEDGQLVFADTPGIHKAKNKLGENMVSIAKQSLNDVDAVLWLVEASTHIGEGDRSIAATLKTVSKPIILVINKIDMVKREEVFGIIDVYKSLVDFVDIVPVSAFKGDNVDELIATIFKYMPYGPYYYDEDTITDQPQRQICAELIREKALRLMDKEIPHGIAVVIDQMKYRKNNAKTDFKYSDPGIYDIDATIICEKDSHKGIIIGKNGSMLKNIGSKARVDMEHMLDCKVNLHLFVKIKKDWRDSDYLIKNFGLSKDTE